MSKKAKKPAAKAAAPKPGKGKPSPVSQLVRAHARTRGKNAQKTPIKPVPAPETSGAKVVEPHPEAAGGRPSSYTPEVAEAFLMSIAASYSPAMAELVLMKIKSLPRTIKQICAAHPELPDPVTIYNWLATNEEFAGKYWRAKVVQALLYAEDLMDHIYDGSKDWVDVVKQDGTTERKLNVEHVMRSKLIADKLQWYLSKMLPRLFGDKLEIKQPEKAKVTKYVVPERRPITPPPQAEKGKAPAAEKQAKKK